jgi:AcrR family transcriptional regulator
MSIIHETASSRRERRSAELRERLFRSALALFGKKGFAETTVEDITEAADVGKGTFFNYFPSKEHILLAFAEMQLSKLENIVGEVLQSNQPVRATLHHIVERMTEAPIQNPAVVRALLLAHLSSPVVRQEMFRFHDMQRRLLGGLFRHGQQRGEIRTDLRAEDIAQVWRQTIFGTLLFWTLAGDSSLTGRVEQSLNMLLDGLVPRDLPHSTQSQTPGEFA